MTNPVVAKDGYTYDEANIAKWVSLSNTSPSTCKQLNCGEWYENRRLKEEIEAWVNVNVVKVFLGPIQTTSAFIRKQIASSRAWCFTKFGGDTHRRCITNAPWCAA